MTLSINAVCTFKCQFQFLTATILGCYCKIFDSAAAFDLCCLCSIFHRLQYSSSLIEHCLLFYGDSQSSQKGSGKKQTEEPRSRLLQEKW